MKKSTQFILFLGAIITTITFMNSCSKTPTTTTTNTTTPTTTISKSEFKWTENGGTEIKADSAFWTTGSWGTGIRAYKGGDSNFFEINWATPNNTSIGAKILDASNYGFTILKTSKVYTITSNATLNLTAFANDSMSGNFSNVATTSTSGGTTSMITFSATFEKIKKK